MLAKTESVYQPALDAGPGPWTWMLALLYTDTGSPGRKGNGSPGGKATASMARYVT